MDQIWLHLLSLSGLLSLTLSKPQDYILVRELMTWNEAQDYCRTNHIDLATVQTDEDWAGLQEAAAEEGFYAFAWFGLYNDINSWRWTHNGESLAYTAWAFDQPNNYGSEECGSIYFDGTWYDFYCDGTRNFVCMDESTNATEKMVLIKTWKTWHDAQTYCRAHYTDLATVRNTDDNDQIANKLNFMMAAVWIGLYRDSWKWSDQANVTSATLLAAQKLNGPSEDCAMTNYYRAIDDVICTSTLYCFCSTVKRKQQVIRVKVKSGGNVDDATLTTLVLNKLQQTLSDQGITLTWRKQENGKVFQKMKTIRNSSNVSAPVC